MPYRTWVNNTTPAISADNLNTIQEGLGYVNVKDRSLTDGGANGDGTTDDRAAIQSAIDALPAVGGVVYFPAGKYKINASGGVGLNLSSKSSITFVGEAATSFNENGTQGVQLIAGSASMVLVKTDGGGANPNHLGPKFRDINFYDGTGGAGSVLLELHDVNHWGLVDCNFGGVAKIGLKVNMDVGSDNAYGALYHCSWDMDAATDQVCIDVVQGNGFHAHACNFSMNGGTGVYIRSGATGYDFTNCKWNYGVGLTGYHARVEGGHNSFLGCHFEGIGGSTNPLVYIDRPASPVGSDGRKNSVISCQFVNCNKGWETSSDADQNTFIGNHFASVTTEFTIGHSQINLLENSSAVIPQWSGGSLGFFQTSPATKQTVTGSRGGNAALASLLTALATYGLITDSSSA